MLFCSLAIYFILIQSIASHSAVTEDTRSDVMCNDLGYFINSLRSRKGLFPLLHSKALDRASKTHTENMIQKNQLSHDIPGHSTFAERAKQSGFRALHGVFVESVFHTHGRNASEAFFEISTSPKHLENMIGRLTHMGCYAKYGHGKCWNTILYALSDGTEAGFHYKCRSKANHLPSPVKTVEIQPKMVSQHTIIHPPAAMRKPLLMNTNPIPGEIAKVNPALYTDQQNISRATPSKPYIIVVGSNSNPEDYLPLNVHLEDAYQNYISTKSYPVSHQE